MNGDKNDKSFIEKTVDTVKDFANIVSDAAKAALEPEITKTGEVAVPPKGDGLITPPEVAPTNVTVPKTPSAKRKASAKSIIDTMTDVLIGANQPPTTKKDKTRARKVAAKKVGKKSGKKLKAKKTAKKAAPKRSAKKAKKRSAKKSLKRTKKKSKR